MGATGSVQHDKAHGVSKDAMVIHNRFKRYLVFAAVGGIAGGAVWRLWHIKFDVGRRVEYYQQLAREEREQRLPALKETYGSELPDDVLDALGSVPSFMREPARKYYDAVIRKLPSTEAKLEFADATRRLAQDSPAEETRLFDFLRFASQTNRKYDLGLANDPEFSGAQFNPFYMVEPKPGAVPAEFTRVEEFTRTCREQTTDAAAFKKCLSAAIVAAVKKTSDEMPKSDRISRVARRASLVALKRCKAQAANVQDATEKRGVLVKCLDSQMRNVSAKLSDKDRHKIHDRATQLYAEALGFKLVSAPSSSSS